VQLVVQQLHNKSTKIEVVELGSYYCVRPKCAIFNINRN